MIENAVGLHGKVAVVTGAGGGIGRAIALGLGRAGAHVVLASRRLEQLEAVRAEEEGLGDKALAVATDISNPESVAQLAEKTMSRFGKIDIIVNNSGILSTKSFLDQSVDDWDSVFSTNVKGTFLVTQALGKHLVAQGHGKVINIASNFALKGISHHAAYCGSKAAVVAITKSLAIEWARHNVQVNALAPGYFETDLTSGVRQDKSLYENIVKAVPARRMGNPNELVPWVLLLAGSASDFMTGETIVVDGGQTAR